MAAAPWLYYVTPSQEKAVAKVARYLHQARSQYPTAKLAIVLDIDDTVLTDSGYKRQLALKTMKELFAYARRLKYDIFFVTARGDENGNYSYTKQQLQRAGFGDFKQLFLMPPALRAERQFSAFKYLVRHKIAKEGYTIVLNCGDSYHDLLVTPDVAADSRSKTIYRGLSAMNPEDYIIFKPPEGEGTWCALRMGVAAKKE